MDEIEHLDPDGPDGTQLWDQREGETDRAWAAFNAYRDAGPLRSLRKLAPIFYAEPDTDSADESRTEKGQFDQLGRWSRQHEWTPRIRAYEQWLAWVTTVEKVEAIRAMNQRQAAIGTIAQQKGAQAIQALQSVELGPTEAMRLVTEGAKLERLARGEPDTIVGGDVRIEHTSDLARRILANDEAFDLAMAALDAVESDASRE